MSSTNALTIIAGAPVTALERHPIAEGDAGVLAKLKATIETHGLDSAAITDHGLVLERVLAEYREEK